MEESLESFLGDGGVVGLTEMTDEGREPFL